MKIIEERRSSSGESVGGGNWKLIIKNILKQRVVTCREN